MIDTRPNELRAALGVERWVQEVALGSPYESYGHLVAVAYDAATPLTPAEIDEALAHHPRIGEKPVGEGAAQAFSRHEQSSSDDADERANAAIAAGNADYEARFGRVFLIRAAGRTRGEILHELQRRLQLDDNVELAIVGEQLREIALLRLGKIYGELQ
jgi:2-oxo-4-hydroxy-4-carboxy-5-ureidoimidazoline decarboxylase